jgi:hypothetical protein
MGLAEDQRTVCIKMQEEGARGTPAAGFRLWIRVVGPHKGPHILLEAPPEVSKRCPEARLEIAGGAGLPPLDWLPARSRNDRGIELRGWPSMRRMITV